VQLGGFIGFIGDIFLYLFFWGGLLFVFFVFLGWFIFLFFWDGLFFCFFGVVYYCFVFLNVSKYVF